MSDPACKVCGKRWEKHPGAERLCREKRALLELLDRAATELHACVLLYHLKDIDGLLKEITELGSKM